MFLYKSEASRLQKSSGFTMETWVQPIKKASLCIPWVCNCMQNFKGGWKFFIPKMFDSYRIVPKVLEEMNGNNQKMPLLVTLKFLVQVKNTISD